MKKYQLPIFDIFSAEKTHWVYGRKWHCE